MKFTATLLALALSATQVKADFWVAASNLEGQPGGPVQDGQNQWLYPKTLDCDEAIHAPLYTSGSDVSKRNGIRIEWEEGGGGGDWLGDSKPTVVEMHRDEWHYTWYVEQGELVDTNHNLKGHCKIDMDTDKECKVSIGFARIQSLLFCTEL